MAALNDDPKGANGSGKCGLVLGPDEVWEWNTSYVLNPQATSEANIFSFYADPKKIFGAGGQFINGCCIDGFTEYSTKCAPNYVKLRFPTFYHRKSELLTFSDNGTYLRETVEAVANPAPDESDFCGSGPGIVKQKLSRVTSTGNWTIRNIGVPAHLRAYYNTRNLLTLQTTSSTGGGFGNSGGIIHALGCNQLVLIQPDREGSKQDLYNHYHRQLTTDPDWYAIK